MRQYSAESKLVRGSTRHNYLREVASWDVNENLAGQPSERSLDGRLADI